MIAHVVLFRPKPDLAPVDADRLLASFGQALDAIPAIRRAHLGRRISIGRGYEQLMQADYPYAAVLEFDDIAGLHQYLDHPAHGEIGSAIFAAAADILVYDFEMGSGRDGLTVVAARI